MRVLSLFSGIGGWDLGLERAGMEIAGQVEIDPWCQKILAKHWPHVPRHGDVNTAVAWWGGRAADVVCGGFPCQPVSVAGKGLAQEDSRWLWPAFADVIRHVGPRYVLVENVPGLLGRGMGDVLGELADLGYDAAWDRIPAYAFGAPHIRERIWILAYAVRFPVRQQPGRGPGQDGPGAALFADDGPARPVADPDSVGRVWWESEQGPWWRTAVGEEEVRHLGDGGESPAAADADGTGRGPWSGSGRPWPSPQRSDWWAAEPGICRMAYGVPRGLDRLRGLGNAVVPQIAEHFGRIIMQHEVAGGTTRALLLNPVSRSYPCATPENMIGGGTWGFWNACPPTAERRLRNG